MFSYKDGILDVRKVEVPDLNLNVMGDLQQSYRKYIEETIYSDMKFLCDEVRAKTSNNNIDLVVKVGNLVSLTYNKTQVSAGKYYYPVTGYFTMNGAKVTDEWDILQIPYMDDYGKINVNGSVKIVLSILRSAEDISYSTKRGLFNIAMPYANIRIKNDPKGIKLISGKHNIPIEQILAVMLYASGDNSRIEDIFSNTILINSFKMNAYTGYKNVYESLVNSTRVSSVSSASDILSRLNSEQYKLGLTRDSINENFNMSRAIGETLSRPVLSYPEGTLVTKGILADIRKNRINTIHVRNTFIPDGYLLVNPINIPRIPKGIKNCKFLRELLPQYASEMYIPETVEFQAGHGLFIDAGEKIDSDIIELLINGGYKKISVKASKTSSKVLVFSFEREIVGNYTARLSELVDSIPKGRSADEWVYYFNNDSLNPLNPDNLTVHDFIAIVSLMGEIMLLGRSPLNDRDTSFLKKVLMINEVFSETLRHAISEYVSSYTTVINRALVSNESRNPFWYLTHKWIRTMNDNAYLATPTTVNLCAEVSQACHINTVVPSNSEIVDEQHQIAIPYLGRLCPYETPAGRKLGLVNTKALGSRIRNGLLETPYRRVYSVADGIAISDNITWMSVKEETGCKFADILSLRKDANGKYINNYILARIPNPEKTDEPFIFKNIRAFDLAGDDNSEGYVSAVPEQYLSPTVSLMPFACADDPVRISYGAAQICQSVYLLNTQRPFLKTKMYDDILTFSADEKYYSPCKGTVVSINTGGAVIKSTMGEELSVQFNNGLHSRSFSGTIELLVEPGTQVVDNQCIAALHKYPDPFVIRAPYDCTIRDITHDAIIISKPVPRDVVLNNSGVVDLERDGLDIIQIQNGRIMGQSAVFMNIHVIVGQTVRKGAIIADTYVSRGGTYSPSRNPLVAYDMFGYNHEDGITASESASVNYTSVITHKISERISTRHYPYMTGRRVHGFTYCAPGDVVGTVQQRKNASDVKHYDRKIRATEKAHGIPFCMGRVEKEKTSRTYEFHLLGFNKLKEGDKMSGRHGNKGVVSKILKDSEVPQLKNGRAVEFINNPCGVPSRMNIGQIMDSLLGLVVEVTGICINSEPFNGASCEDIEMLVSYVYDLANTPEIGDNVLGNFNKAAFDQVCSRYPQLPKEYHQDVWKNIRNVLDWRGVFERDGSAILYDPQTDTYFDGPMLIGFPMYLKLMQEADEKINSRAGELEEQYARTTSQPQKGQGSKKGQRMAEMELMALVAYGAADMIEEIINEKSDNEGMRVNRHLEALGLPQRVDKSSCYSRAVENLMYLFEGCGVIMDVDPDIVDISARTSMQKYTMDLQKLVKENLSYIGGNQEKNYPKHETTDDLMKIKD